MILKKKYDVVVVGELNVDLIANGLSKFPEVGKEIIANQFVTTLGSSSAIFASNLSAFGTKVTFTGKVGNDNYGDFIVAALKARRVDVNNIVRTGKPDTGVTIVLNYDEDRAMVTYQGAMAAFNLGDIPDNVLEQARHLHLSSVFLQESLKKDIVLLFKKAKQLGLTTSLDPQWDPAEKWDIDWEKLLGYVDIFMPNQAELNAITNTTTIPAAIDVLKDFSNILVVKNGREGAILWTDNNLIHQPAFFNNSVVDSIGAGDSFNAGFIHAFLQGRTLKECMEFGALMGAINTTSSGGTMAFENMSKVKEIAKSSFDYTF
ncbi:carbohydrate kinase family protein [Adhaeribacter swui]|uniref:Carbohydrate kinase family protein n=1 Tax=Adhaeribacter swui TaxID=2086471 RepID=A0A7G7G8N1_9BACT|nr:carbohydrate kinase family protein [Adhaeribacter swui]QNF33515.1 carbohydrate kinase family protein [Adhaeribacter swui]